MLRVRAAETAPEWLQLRGTAVNFPLRSGEAVTLQFATREEAQRILKQAAEPGK